MRGAIPVTWPARYELVVPEGQAPEGGWPLVVALHGAEDALDRFSETLEPWSARPCARLLIEGPFPVEVRRDEGRRLGRVWYHYTGEQEAFLQSLRFARDHVMSVMRTARVQAPLSDAPPTLFGYSMGGYVAGFMALDRPRDWGRLLQVATRLKVEAFTDRLGDARALDVVMIHGEKDRLVPIRGQERALEKLEAAGVPARLVRSPAGHRLSPEIVTLAAEYLPGPR